MNNPKYTGSKIKNVSSICHLLDIGEDKLEELLDNINQHYKSKEIPKKNNKGFRLINAPSKTIKNILQKLNARVFSNISFPNYLYGSIPDASNPRDYIKCAQLHCKSKVLIKIDIRDFFSHITEQRVYEIFFNLFCFSADVSTILSKLTTLNGVVPQGAPTSTYIANLCFFDREPQIVKHLTENGFRYSRLIDDITISHLDNKKSWQWVSDRVKTMITGLGFFINEDKSSATSNSSSQSFKVHGLCVNNESPHFPKNEVESIKKRTHHVLTLALKGDNNRKTGEYHKLFYSTLGKITKLKRVNNPKYPALKGALRKYALPLPSETEKSKLKIAVRNLEKIYATHKDKPFYKTRFYRIHFRLNVFQRIYRLQARSYRQRLLLIQPT